MSDDAIRAALHRIAATTERTLNHISTSPFGKDDIMRLILRIYVIATIGEVHDSSGNMERLQKLVDDDPA